MSGFCENGHPFPPGTPGCPQCAQRWTRLKILREHPTEPQNLNEIPKHHQEPSPLWGWLYTYDIDRQGISFPLNYGVYTIGSEPSQCHICFPAEAGVAPIHALLEVHPEGCTLRDAGSPHGTLVNGVAVPVCHGLGDEDSLKIGKILLFICTKMISNTSTLYLLDLPQHSEENNKGQDS